MELELIEVCLIGLSTGIVIAGWYGFTGLAVKYAIKLLNLMGR